MNISTISFIILVGLLFAGIFILIYPTSLVSRLSPSEMAPNSQPLQGTIVPKGIIILGSVLTITGLVGLSILGFKLFSESEKSEIKK
jgi:hypothetical protein